MERSLAIFGSLGLLKILFLFAPDILRSFLNRFMSRYINYLNHRNKTEVPLDFSTILSLSPISVTARRFIPSAIDLVILPFAISFIINKEFFFLLQEHFHVSYCSTNETNRGTLKV